MGADQMDVGRGEVKVKLNSRAGTIPYGSGMMTWCLRPAPLCTSGPRYTGLNDDACPLVLGVLVLLVRRWRAWNSTRIDRF